MDRRVDRESGPASRSRAFGPVLFVVTAVAVAALVTAVVVAFEDTYGDQTATRPDGKMLVLGAVLALAVGAAALPALRLAGETRWVKVVVAVVVLGVLVAPYLARMADIERARDTRASARVALVNRSEPLAPGVADSATRMEAAIEDLELGADAGPVLEGGGGRAVLWILATDVEEALSAYRQRLTEAGWLMTSEPGADALTADRVPLHIEVVRAEDGNLQLTVTDDAFSEASESN
ncbi:hypothetical protein LL946_00735 [Knoellia locipacati]|uniref:hypothetical protein n=1 Tax=Knoellia locipacati TaxID=882824 RepID=UPI00384F9EA0